jgi:hypothetical protein
MGLLHFAFPTVPFGNFYLGDSDVYYGVCGFLRRGGGYCLSNKPKNGGGSVPKECTLCKGVFLVLLRIHACPLPATPPSTAQKHFKATETSAYIVQKHDCVVELKL